ncbi:MAG: hypothetical protein V1789_08515, partial [PVC group bacterium]
MKRHLIGAAVLVTVISPLAAASPPLDLPVLRGTDWNPITIDDERLDYKKIVVQDIIADLKSNFLPMEKKRGFKEHSYYKFVLRDSKLACFIRKYSRREMENFKNIQRGERITVVGRLERAGKGMRRLVNPKFLFKVEEIRKGWEAGEGETVLEAFPGE